MAINNSVLIAVEAAARINDDGSVDTVMRDARRLHDFIMELSETKTKAITEQFRLNPEEISPTADKAKII